MQNDRLFDQIFQRYGTRLDPSDLKHFGLDRMLGDLRILTPDIQCDYLSNLSANAMASKKGSERFIAIYAGLTLQLTCFYYTLLSDPEILPDIGDKDKESYSVERNKLLASPLVSPQTLHVCGQRPRCETRFAVAWALTSCSHIFIFFHEVAHIYLGHLDIMSRYFGMDVYAELPIDDLGESENAVRRAMELDADDSAALTGLKYWREVWKVDYAPAKEGELALPERDFIWEMALNSLMLFWEWKRLQAGRKGLTTHPSPYQRMLNIKFSLTEAEKVGVDRLQVSLPKAYLAPMREIAQWLVEHHLPAHRASFFREGNGAAQMVSTWAALRPYLAEMSAIFESNKRK